MDNFEYLLPTRVVFGKDTHLQAGALLKPLASRVLLHYGSGSVVKSGVHAQVLQSLQQAGLTVFELGGVQPNPRVSLVREGVALCKREGIGAILALGGGSVIDSAKAIAIGAYYEGDVWDFYAGKAQATRALPVGVVLTLAAAGSETSKNSVITNEDGGFKRGYASQLERPAFAILNPELTYTLPWEQTAYGAVDIMAHVMERYFSPASGQLLTDELCEATLRTVMARALDLQRNGADYEARAEMMWAGSIAHSDFLSVGRPGDWASHQIEHELSGMYDVPHGAGLAVVIPAWMKWAAQHKPERFLRFAATVMGVCGGEKPEKAVAEGIARLEAFYQGLGLATRLSGLNIDASHLEEMALKTRLTNGDGTLGGLVRLRPADVLEILQLAL